MIKYGNMMKEIDNFVKGAQLLPSEEQPPEDMRDGLIPGWDEVKIDINQINFKEDPDFVTFFARPDLQQLEEENWDLLGKIAEYIRGPSEAERQSLERREMPARK